jgi:signal transduction histidine kinase
VVDDGCGFGTEARAAAGTNGHVGLRLLDDLARDAGGTLDVTSSPGSGTRLRLEVPIG